MRQVVAKILVLVVISPFTFAADAVLPPQLILDKVLFQVSAKQWVTTQSALLRVHVNVTLSNADLVKARSDIMERLKKIAAGDWHLIAFERSQDSSGLEKLYVQAQARVPQTALTDVYQNAKSVSIPGAQYEVANIEFKPSLEETQAVLAKVREQLYQQVNDEVARLNKVYPTQNYSVNHLVFVSGNTPVAQTTRAYQAKEMNTMVMSAGAVPSSDIAVSNELMLTAVVEAASNRK